MDEIKWLEVAVNTTPDRLDVSKLKWADCAAWA